MSPLTPLLAYARTRGELQALGVDVSPETSLDEVIARVQARITQVATAKQEYFERELLDELTRFWRMLNAARAEVARSG